MKPTVTIVNIADVPLHVPTGLGREGSSASKPFPLDSGVPGVRLEFTWRRYDKGYGTPRHTHIFDQYRYNFTGKRQIKDGFVEAGEVAFYPEGAYYGPQLQEEECTGLGLQFQGLTGIRYLTHKELGDARKALSAEGGTFKGGVYTKILPDGRKINRDSHLACTEYVTGHKVDFPKPRFDKPIVMKPQGSPWIGDRKVAGLDHKHLGLFGGSGIRFMRLAPGARFRSASKKMRRSVISSTARSNMAARPGLAARRRIRAPICSSRPAPKSARSPPRPAASFTSSSYRCWPIPPGGWRASRRARRANWHRRSNTRLGFSFKPAARGVPPAAAGLLLGGNHVR